LQPARRNRRDFAMQTRSNVDSDLSVAARLMGNPLGR
jgi:hypothetical protein